MTIYHVNIISASDTWDLRHRVLRPNSPVESVRYPEDDSLESIHLGAILQGKIVAVASIYRQPEEGSSSVTAWRLRGMATDPLKRGQGLGGTVLKAAIGEARNREGSYLWCNARISVSGFYEKYGFNIRGPEFEMPDIGPHYFMILPF